MTNNHEDHEHDDFIEPEIGLSDEAQHTRGMGGNLAEAWRTKPLFKFIVLIAAVVGVGVAGMSFLGGSSSSSGDLAHLTRPPNLKEAPGGVTSPYMRQQTELANKERSDQAIANGGSALPTPIGQASDVGNLSGTDKANDPLNELRAETEKLKAQVQQQQIQQQQQQQQARSPQQQQQEQFDNSLAEAMQRQMNQLLDSWKPTGIKSVQVIKPEDLKAEQAKETAAANPAGGTSIVNSQAQPVKIVVNAGTVSYAQLLTEANSDVPGPILAQIVSGPLAGARAIGSFEVADGYEKYLVMRFSLADKKSKDYQITAYALDPDTTLGGMATEVDERYFTRVVLPAAAGFLQGLGQALGQGNSTVTTDGTTTIASTTSNGFHQGIYTGLGDAAQTAGQFFQNQANLTKPLVRVAAGTPIGLFFVTPVLEPSAQAGTAFPPQQGIGSANGNMSNYPGTTVNGYGNANNGGAPYPNYAGQGQQNGYGSQQNPYGAPYPNYATPASSYGAGNYNRPLAPGIGTGFATTTPYTQSYGQ
jgi:intracellular multiplication protein IcmE